MVAQTPSHDSLSEQAPCGLYPVGCCWSPVCAKLLRSVIGGWHETATDSKAHLQRTDGLNEGIASELVEARHQFVTGSVVAIAESVLDAE